MPFCKVQFRAPRPLPAAYPTELRTWGDHLRRRRLDLGLRQEDVAREAGVHRNTLQTWEQNLAQPAVCLLPRLIQFLGYAPLEPARSLGKRLSRARRALGLTQRQFAEVLGVGRASVDSWETGRRPSKRSRARIGQLLGLDG